MMKEVDQLLEHTRSDENTSAMLDSLVDSISMLNASKINNKGMESQMKFLLENGMSIEKIIEGIIE